MERTLTNTLEPLAEAIQSGLETGDYEYAGYCTYHRLDNAIALGMPLDTVLEITEQYLELATRIEQSHALFTLRLCRQLVLNLLGRAENPRYLKGESFDEGQELEKYRDLGLDIVLFAIYCNKMVVLYLFGADAEAVACGEEALAHQDANHVKPYEMLFVFYYTLALLAVSTEEGDRRQDYLHRAEVQQHRLQNWANCFPSGFQHKCDLVEAEKAGIAGNAIAAMELYDKAIAGAKAGKFSQDEALASELAARFYLAWGKVKFAGLYLQQAYYAYSRWGAKGKIDALERDYAHLLSPILHPSHPGTPTGATIAPWPQGTIASTTTGTGILFDLASLMKASRTLTEAIDLDRAIANLMQVAMENAGAETAALMLLHGETLMLEAQITGRVSQNHFPNPVEAGETLPLSVINTVKRTGKPLLLDNASQNPTHARDSYIQKHQTRSILCAPLTDRGQLRGILYLENNQAVGAFTSDRVEILNLLCSQAAIALENARLYRQAQQALRDLQQAQLQLVQKEKMATLGNLVAGVAHEINNPLGFIGGNVKILQENLADLSEIVAGYRQELSEPSPQLAEAIEELDLDFLLEDIPETIASMQIGVDRIANISTSLRTFSRTDTDCKTAFNLHEGLDSTLLILKYRLKANEQRPAIEIIKNYGNIPDVKCYVGQINQVLMNLLANAIDALEESNEGKTYDEIEIAPNCITIATELSNNKTSAIVRIVDNGKGMSEAVKARLFEQGFTTKEVGKGTGLGMAIARQIVEEKHGGAIACESELGKGTEFIISLPLG